MNFIFGITIEPDMPEANYVTLKIFDILGREIKTLINNELKVRWKYSIPFEAKNYASGVYFYQLHIDPSGGGAGFTKTGKMVLIR